VLLGTLEALAGGLISSHFKDAVAFVALLLTLFWRPAGLLGRGAVERV
jgi:branched-chain amino acid transport system permease protein